MTVFKTLCFSLLLSSALLRASYGDTTAMNQSLVQIIHQLVLIKPLIQQAKAEQPAHARFRVHFDPWRSGDGVEHPGLLQDIMTIQEGLMAAINRIHDPRIYPPIKGDFVRQDHV
jgi:RAQPRD family integrative conjugative element protein